MSAETSPVATSPVASRLRPVQTETAPESATAGGAGSAGAHAETDTEQRQEAHGEEFCRLDVLGLISPSAGWLCFWGVYMKKDV